MGEEIFLKLKGGGIFFGNQILEKGNFIHSKIKESSRRKWDEQIETKSKAGYTANQVACGWAGARITGRDSYKKTTLANW